MAAYVELHNCGIQTSVDVVINRLLRPIPASEKRSAAQLLKIMVDGSYVVGITKP